MNRYWLFACGLMVLFLMLFGVVETAKIPLLIDPSNQMNQSQTGAALLGIGLLSADVFLPVPSSLIMVLMGAIFGVTRGALISMIGSTGACIIGFWLGRRGSSYLQAYVSPAEQTQANRLFQQWGWLAILITRPIPILAETVIIMAGTTSISWSAMLGASIAGIIPAAFLYALAGANAADTGSFLLTFSLMLILAGLVWLASYFLRRFTTSLEV